MANVSGIAASLEAQILSLAHAALISHGRWTDLYQSHPQLCASIHRAVCKAMRTAIQIAQSGADIEDIQALQWEVE